MQTWIQADEYAALQVGGWMDGQMNWQTDKKNHHRELDLVLELGFGF